MLRVDGFGRYRLFCWIWVCFGWVQFVLMGMPLCWGMGLFLSLYLLGTYLFLLSIWVYVGCRFVFFVVYMCVLFGYTCFSWIRACFCWVQV